MFIAYAFEYGMKEENVFRDRPNLQLGFERYEVLAGRSSTLFVKDSESKRHHKVYVMMSLRNLVNIVRKDMKYGSRRRKMTMIKNMRLLKS